MTHAEMERELSRTTGESIAEIRHRGFSLIETPDQGLSVVDWDAVQQKEQLRYKPRRRPVRRLLAA